MNAKYNFLFNYQVYKKYILENFFVDAIKPYINEKRSPPFVMGFLTAI